MRLILFISLFYCIAVTSAYLGFHNRPVNRPPFCLRALDSSATSADADLEELKVLTLYPAASTRSMDPAGVVEALISAEKLTKVLNRGLSKASKSMSDDLRPRLCGSWRLVFTTGTLKTQKKVGRLSYFPLKAVQTFDAEGGISNAIYVGSLPLVKFVGRYKLVEVAGSMVRVEFDFDSVRLFDSFDVTLGGGALEVGERTGLGSGTGVEGKEDGKKKAFFNWCIADDKIATARGGGGGIALWRRIQENE